MPLTLNVGLNRKVGEPNYGSRGASVCFEVEIESGLVREPDELRERIRYLFGLAKEAVEEELNGNSSPSTNGHSGNGHRNGHDNNGNGSRRPANGRSATASQVRAIHAIASRNRIDLDGHLRDEFGVSKPDDLSIGQASEFIDALKSQSNGTGGRR
jgi:hypothetical protein